MPQRHVLFLDASRLTAYLIDRGSVHAEGEFTADAAGLVAFDAYLAQRCGSVFQLLVDVAEEDFQLEEIPHSTGKDRAALVCRKLSQHFYGTPFTLAASLGRRHDGRRDERLLLMALTRPQYFEPWLAVMQAAKAVLASIHSLPQTIGNLLPQPLPQHLLVITLSRAGLRQTFFSAGQLRFSRLTSLATNAVDPVVIATATACEADKMHQYLASQMLIESDRPLAIQVLAHPSHTAALHAHCQDSHSLHFSFIDLLVAIRRAGLHAALADSRAELLFCHLLAKKPPTEQFAPTTARYFHQIQRTRSRLNLANALILAGGLLFATHKGINIWLTQASIAQIEQQTQFDQQRYDLALQALPKTQLTTENLRLLVDHYEAVLKRSPGPQPLLTQLSRSLDVFPPIEIDRIEWAIAEQLPPTTVATSSHPILPHLTNGPYAQARIDARLPLSLSGDQRGQLTLVAEFVKHLEARPDTLVSILHPPIDTQSGQTLKSDNVRQAPEAPRFSFLLIRKL